MVPKDMKKTTLITKTRLYDWTVMPFGLKNATNIFTKTMLEVFKDLGDKFLKVFVDDLNVHNESWAKHLQHLDVVFFKLREVNLKLNPNKCCFGTKNITFLGHVVSNKRTKPDLGKIETLLHFPEPKTITNIKSFLGLIGYYHNYVSDYSQVAASLFELTKKDIDFVWNLGYQQAFEVLKITLVDAPVLIWPDSRNHFVLMLSSHQKVLEPSCHKRKANLRRWWLMLVRV